ncbi:unnamed protein product [Danaus chrysippus]|uniref:(African queen) hypothetical protein n=1 Tax=Danaus chrysippus TaxID=151541 RepID=A0A8J2WDE6_9NEOP|nr:unnamed protein product [Danaus chrysippus]
MSDDAEQQAEEIEVLKSIYEGDENFKQVDSKTYQYKYIDDIFYNQSLLPSVKENILSIVNAEADQWVGCAMTYTIFEGLKEKVKEILEAQTEEAVVARV